jgi:hypothetical protein
VRDSTDNPFSPGSDTVPEIWAGRLPQINDWRDVLRPRLLRGLPERGRTILGEPGLGKSSLVRRIAQHAAREGDWVTPQLRIPLGADPMKMVAAAVLALADSAGLAASREKRIKEALASVRSVAASGVSVTLAEREEGSKPEAHTALTGLLVEIGRAARRRGNVALIHIDEVQNITDEAVLSQLLIALGDAIAFEEVVELSGGVRVQRLLPIAVYLTGLPDFQDRAGALKGATFARRFQPTILAPIDDADIRAALDDFVDPGWDVPDGEGGSGRVSMTPEAASAIVDLCRGEPFLFQLAGQRAWYAGVGSVITREEVLSGWRDARDEAAAHVERILDRLPQREREFLEVMARIPEGDRTLTRIAQESGRAKAAEEGTTARRLDRTRGIVVRGKTYGFRHRAIEAYLTTTWPDPEAEKRV